MPCAAPMPRSAPHPPPPQDSPGYDDRHGGMRRPTWSPRQNQIQDARMKGRVHRDKNRKGNTHIFESLEAAPPVTLATRSCWSSVRTKMMRKCVRQRTE